MSRKSAALAFKKFNVRECVVKGAGLAPGGAGRRGFVRLVKSRGMRRRDAAASSMLTRRMVSPQTGPEGVPGVPAAGMLPAIGSAAEYYLGIAIDRKLGSPVMIASAQGGVENRRKWPRRTRKAVIREPIHPLLGLLAFQARELADELGFKGKIAAEAGKMIHSLWGCSPSTDASLVEVNPLVVTKRGAAIGHRRQGGVRRQRPVPASGDSDAGR